MRGKVCRPSGMYQSTELSPNCQTTDPSTYRQFFHGLCANADVRGEDEGVARVATRGTLVLATALFSGLICASAATAQVTSADQRCIAAFNQGVRKVTKAQSKIVKKCLTDFASGRLSSARPGAGAFRPQGEPTSAVVKGPPEDRAVCTGSTPLALPVENAYVRASLADRPHPRDHRSRSQHRPSPTPSAHPGAGYRCAPQVRRPPPREVSKSEGRVAHGVATAATLR